MNFVSRQLWALLATALLAGCATAGQSNLPTGDAAYAVVPPADYAAPPTAYRIRAGDELQVRVFQEPDLSVEKLKVDEVGRVQLPLVGDMIAVDKTTADLAAEITMRLGTRYIRNPSVVVNLASSRAQTVAVEGQVGKPGVYEVGTQSTLLSALAQAESPTKTAKLDEVVVFRTVNGRRMGARFDLDAIRNGRAADPQLIGGDVVVVGFDAVKGAFRDFLTAAPLLYVFNYF